MNVPNVMDILDKSGGFYAATNLLGKRGPSVAQFMKLGPKDKQSVMARHSFDTRWRPGYMLKAGSKGILLHYYEHTVYAQCDDATLAFYTVPGYHYLVAVWFDSKTGERLA